MRLHNVIMIAHDLIVSNIYCGRGVARLARRNWARHLRYATPEPRNAYGYPIVAYPVAASSVQ